MSIDVTWPEYKSERELMEKDVFNTHFNSEDAYILKKLSDSGKKKLFNFICSSGWHVNKELLK